MIRLEAILVLCVILFEATVATTSAPSHAELCRTSFFPVSPLLLSKKQHTNTYIDIFDSGARDHLRAAAAAAAATASPKSRGNNATRMNRDIGGARHKLATHERNTS